MPVIRVADDLEMHYRRDDFSDPWTTPETVLMLHGNAENGGVWFGWVPWLARHYCVIRPDMRGFGKSTPMRRDYRWTVNTVVDDYMFLMDALKVEHFHLIGAKMGGLYARRLAARFPQRLRTLTLVGTVAPSRPPKAAFKAEQAKEIESQGAEAWARRSMGSRLGSRFPAAGAEWWIRQMAKTDPHSFAGYSFLEDMDVGADLPNIRCPTLVISTEGSKLGTAEETRAWQERIPNSRLLVLPGDSYHVAASDADRCAQEARDFIRAQNH